MNSNDHYARGKRRGRRPLQISLPRERADRQQEKCDGENYFQPRRKTRDPKVADVSTREPVNSLYEENNHQPTAPSQKVTSSAGNKTDTNSGKS
jgi:hypothetical protein